MVSLTYWAIVSSLYPYSPTCCDYKRWPCVTSSSLILKLCVINRWYTDEADCYLLETLTIRSLECQSSRPLSIKSPPAKSPTASSHPHVQTRPSMYKHAPNNVAPKVASARVAPTTSPPNKVAPDTVALRLCARWRRVLKRLVKSWFFCSIVYSK